MPASGAFFVQAGSADETGPARAAETTLVSRMKRGMMMLSEQVSDQILHVADKSLESVVPCRMNQYSQNDHGAGPERGARCGFSR